MNWFLESPTHWIRCVEISVVLGIATFKLYDDALTHTGRARRGRFGWLVEAQ
jgi:hypothetical protein